MIETLLEVRNLSKTFRYRTGWFRRQTVEAVKPLSFTLRECQTLAIIGENGSVNPRWQKCWRNDRTYQRRVID